MRSLLLSLFLLVGAVSPFNPSSRQSATWGIVRSTKSASKFTCPPLHMFRLDDNDKTKSQSTSTSFGTPLQVADNTDANNATTDTPTVRNVVRDMNTGEIKEVKWVDPAMRANTRPWEMSWWAYIAFGFPFIILANDVFHFLPKDGPIGFLGRM